MGLSPLYRSKLLVEMLPFVICSFAGSVLGKVCEGCGAQKAKMDFLLTVVLAMVGPNH